MLQMQHHFLCNISCVAIAASIGNSLKYTTSTDVTCVDCHIWFNCFSSVAIGFTLKGVNYPNGSTVLRTDIGEGDDALLCTTDRVGCCSGTGRAGEFYFPNGTKVPIPGGFPSVHSYYRNRGVGFICLHRRPHGYETGRFSCEIPDQTDGIFINVGMFKMVNISC